MISYAARTPERNAPWTVEGKNWDVASPAARSSSFGLQNYTGSARQPRRERRLRLRAFSDSLHAP
jgi:hypothetical protein